MPSAKYLSSSPNSTRIGSSVPKRTWVQRLTVLGDWLTRPDASVQRPELRRQARLLSALLALFLLLQVVAVELAAYEQYGSWNPLAGPLSLLGAVVFVLYVSEYVLSRTRAYPAAAVIFVATILGEVLGAMALTPPNPFIPVFLIIAMLVGMLLLSPALNALVFALSLTAMLQYPTLVPIRDRAEYYSVSALVLTAGLLIQIAAWLAVRDRRQIREQAAIAAKAVEDRKRVEEAMRSSALRTETLARSAARLNAQLDMDSLLGAICDETMLVLDFPAASLTFYDPATDSSHFVAATGLPPDYMQLRVPIQPTLFEQYSSRRGPLFVLPDVQAESDASLYLRHNIRTIGTASMLNGKDLIGGLNIYNFAVPRALDENERLLFQGLAERAVQAISGARLFADLRRRIEEMQALLNIDRAITGTVDLRLTLNVFLDEVMEHLKVDAASVLLFNPYTHLLEYAVGRGFRTDLIERSRLRLGEGAAGAAALEGKVRHIPNLKKSSDDFARQDLAEMEDFVCYYGMPLAAKGSLKGVLEIFHRSRLQPDDNWMRFLDALSAQVAIAIDNATLFNDLQRSNAELLQAYDSTLEGLARVIDLRDKSAEGHTNRVAELTVQLARAMGVGAWELGHIRRGALLHDIGKLGVPDQTLLKPARLTNEEQIQVQMYPQYAFEMLSPIAYLRDAMSIPYRHREKWDGSGYPRGLKGEQIPLAARIFSVVDTWEALISDRPYRPAWPKSKALQYIADSASTSFDPKVVEAFLEMIQDGGEIAD